MRVCHIIFTILFLFNAVQSQLLNGVSHVLDNISGTTGKPSLDSHLPSSPSNPPSSVAALPSVTTTTIVSQVHTPPPAPTTSSSPPPVPPPPPPPPAITTTTEEKPTTTPKSGDKATDSPLKPPPVVSNKDSPTHDTPALITPTILGDPTPKASKTTGPKKPTSTMKSDNGSDSSDDSDDIPTTGTNGVTNKPVVSNNKGSSGNKTGTIIGAVVGSIFGVALIGGALTWINRRGGCATRNNKRSADFEDFGLADTDFPHHRSHPMQSALVTNAAVTPVSPTIPRLNDQGNFYGGSEEVFNNNGGFVPAYQPQLEPQSYYNHYQQQDGDYYNDGGYHYGNQSQNNMANNTSYDMVQQYQAYNNTTGHTYSDTMYNNDNHYKPNQVDVNPQKHM